ncbi:MAG: hypothetical protein ABEJ72_07060, partial [Candidatus Aenigmatarchaeota archaeon]
MKEIDLKSVIEEAYEEGIVWAQENDIDDINLDSLTEEDVYRHEILPELRRMAGFENNEEDITSSYSERENVKVHYFDGDMVMWQEMPSYEVLRDVQLAWKTGVADIANEDRL